MITTTKRSKQFKYKACILCNWFRLYPLRILLSKIMILQELRTNENSQCSTSNMIEVNLIIQLLRNQLLPLMSFSLRFHFTISLISRLFLQIRRELTSYPSTNQSISLRLYSLTVLISTDSRHILSYQVSSLWICESSSYYKEEEIPIKLSASPPMIL